MKILELNRKMHKSVAEAGRLPTRTGFYSEHTTRSWNRMRKLPYSQEEKHELLYENRWICLEKTKKSCKIRLQVVYKVVKICYSDIKQISGEQFIIHSVRGVRGLYMKKMQRIGAMLLAASMGISMMQTGVLAADTVQADTAWQQTAAQTFTGFANAGTKIAEVSFTFGQAESELTAQMPQTLTAYLTDGTTVEIPVSWVCLGDYANTDDYYYEYVPQWDMSAYAPEGVLDSTSGVPYVLAYRVDAVDSNTQPGVSTKAALSSNVYTIFNFLVSECGFHAAAACGVIANIECESNFNPNLWGDNNTSYGICQWHNERLTAMKNWCDSNGYSWKTLEGQLNYLKKELSANNSAYLYNGLTIANKLKAKANTADGAYDAGYDWCYYYEVPANKEFRSKERGNRARDTYWPQLKDSSVTVAPDETQSGQVYSIFSDVKKGAWYCTPIQYVYDNGIMTGTSKTKFEPNTSLNRAMAATVLYKLSQTNSKLKLSSTNKASFSDVPSDAWYATAVKWAAGAGIVKGYDNGTFGPTNKITREQFATILYAYAKKLGCNVSATTSLSSYSDSGSISSYATTAMKWAVAKKIMSGSDGKLRPKSSLTRAEAAAMIRSFAATVA